MAEDSTATKSIDGSHPSLAAAAVVMAGGTIAGSSNGGSATGSLSSSSTAPVGNSTSAAVRIYKSTTIGRKIINKYWKPNKNYNIESNLFCRRLMPLMTLQRIIVLQLPEAFQKITHQIQEIMQLEVVFLILQLQTAKKNQLFLQRVLGQPKRNIRQLH